MNQKIAFITKAQENPLDSLFFQPQNKPVEIPFELTNNHIFVRVKINNFPAPYWFIFDTGAAASLIDLELAKSLGLTLQGQVQAGGAGENSPVGALIKDTYFSISGLKDFSQPLQVAMPLSSLSSYEGRPVVGVLGYEFISQYVIEIDYAAYKLRLYDKEKFEYAGAGEIIPLTFKFNHPHIRARVEQSGRTDSIEGDFVIDTGSRLPIMLTKPFVEKYQFLQFAPRTIQAVIGVGVGGESRALVGRVKNLKLGKLMVENPLVNFSQDEKGVLATSQFFEGNIGSEILRRFKVIFDYPRNRMILEKTSQSDMPFETDMSGAFLIAEGADFNTFKVRSVIENSPATEAGLREGDLITAINNEAAINFTLEQIRQMFKQNGREYKLTVRRNAETLQIKLRLRKLI